jgi:hypothetical protein
VFYELTTEESTFWDNILTRCTREIQHNILGPEGQKMQADVWREIIAVLGERVLEVRGIVGVGA